MVILLIAVALLLSPTYGRPQEPAPAAPQASPQQGESTPIPIVSQSAETKEDGGFSYSFETGNGIKVQETGTLKEVAPIQGNNAVDSDQATDNKVVVLEGSFSYTGPDGQVYSVKYIADENGFQPEGDHLPTPPPGLEDILKQSIASGTQQQPQLVQPQQQPQPVQSQQQPLSLQPQQVQPQEQSQQPSVEV